MSLETIVEKFKATIETLPSDERTLLATLAGRISALSDPELRQADLSAAKEENVFAGAHSAGIESDAPKDAIIESDNPKSAIIESDEPRDTIIESDNPKSAVIESD